MTIAPEVAMSLLRPAFLGWLADLAGNGVYWQLPQEPTNPPVLLIQTRDQGTLKRYVGGGALWQGTIQVRAQATTLDAAETLATAARAAIPAEATLTEDDGTEWSLTLLPGVPLVSTPGRTINTAGQTYRVRLER